MGARNAGSALRLSPRDYVPIPCAEHEKLEYAVLRRQALRLRWREAGDEREQVVLPLDVTTRDGAEWLHCRLPGGEIAVLRLDDLIAAVPA